MPTDHDRIVAVEIVAKDVCNDMKDVLSRLRSVEDTLLQAKTAVVFAKAIFGLVTLDVVIQLVTLLHINL